MVVASQPSMEMTVSGESQIAHEAVLLASSRGLRVFWLIDVNRSVLIERLSHLSRHTLTPLRLEKIEIINRSEVLNALNKSWLWLDDGGYEFPLSEVSLSLIKFSISYSSAIDIREGQHLSEGWGTLFPLDGWLEHGQVEVQLSSLEVTQWNFLSNRLGIEMLKCTPSMPSPIRELQDELIYLFYQQIERGVRLEIIKLMWVELWGGGGEGFSPDALPIHALEIFKSKKADLNVQKQGFVRQSPNGVELYRGSGNWSSPQRISVKDIPFVELQQALARWEDVLGEKNPLKEVFVEWCRLFLSHRAKWKTNVDLFALDRSLSRCWSLNISPFMMMGALPKKLFQQLVSGLGDAEKTFYGLRPFPEYWIGHEEVEALKIEPFVATQEQASFSQSNPKNSKVWKFSPATRRHSLPLSYASSFDRKHMAAQFRNGSYAVWETQESVLCLSHSQENRMGPDFFEGVEFALSSSLKTEKPLIIGSSEGDFSGGEDWSWMMSTMDQSGIKALENALKKQLKIVKALRALPLPVFFSMDGRIFGGASSFLSLADQSFVGPKTTLSFEAGTLGLPTLYGGMQMWAGMIGNLRGRAAREALVQRMELFYSGRVIQDPQLIAEMTGAHNIKMINRGDTRLELALRSARDFNEGILNCPKASSSMTVLGESGRSTLLHHLDLGISLGKISKEQRGMLEDMIQVVSGMGVKKEGQLDFDVMLDGELDCFLRHFSRPEVISRLKKALT